MFKALFLPFQRLPNIKNCSNYRDDDGVELFKYCRLEMISSFGKCISQNNNENIQITNTYPYVVSVSAIVLSAIDKSEYNSFTFTWFVTVDLSRQGVLSSLLLVACIVVS